MKTGTHVRLDKLSEQNAGLLPTGYWLLGHLRAPIEVGRPIEVARYARARQTPDEPEVVERLGKYTSSPVRSITRDEFDSNVFVAVTQNSHWRVTELAPVEVAQVEQVAQEVSEAAQAGGNVAQSGAGPQIEA